MFCDYILSNYSKGEKLSSVSQSMLDNMYAVWIASGATATSHTPLGELTNETGCQTWKRVNIVKNKKTIQARDLRGLHQLKLKKSLEQHFAYDSLVSFMHCVDELEDALTLLSC